MLIAIEGIDGSGKGTQAALLVETLRSQGRTAALFGFPRYTETFFGARIGEFLNGKYGALGDVHPLLAALLFAGDRYESLPRLQQLQAEHEIVVLDRYVASNIAHQAAKRDGEERLALTAQIQRLEFEVYALPRPDRVILLDIPAERARELVARKARRNYTEAVADLQESDTNYQRHVRAMYLELCATDPAWRAVNIVDADGVLRPIPAIATDVLRAATAD